MEIRGSIKNPILTIGEIMDNCKYGLVFPNDGKIHCDAYGKSIRPDGYHWAHYPYCNEENCPLKHPELLEGAVLTE